MVTTAWGKVRRDKGRMWGRVGAWCLSWWQRDPVGISWSKQVAPQPGQAQGPLIHSTPPLVPTGRGRAFSLLPLFGCHNSSGGRVISLMCINGQILFFTLNLALGRDSAQLWRVCAVIFFGALLAYGL